MRAYPHEVRVLRETFSDIDAPLVVHDTLQCGGHGGRADSRTDHDRGSILADMLCRGRVRAVNLIICGIGVSVYILCDTECARYIKGQDDPARSNSR